MGVEDGTLGKTCVELPTPGSKTNVTRLGNVPVVTVFNVTEVPTGFAVSGPWPTFPGAGC